MSREAMVAPISDWLLDRSWRLFLDVLQLIELLVIHKFAADSVQMIRNSSLPSFEFPLWIWVTSRGI